MARKERLKGFRQAQGLFLCFLTVCQALHPPPESGSQQSSHGTPPPLTLKQQLEYRIAQAHPLLAQTLKTASELEQKKPFFLLDATVYSEYVQLSQKRLTYGLSDLLAEAPTTVTEAFQALSTVLDDVDDPQALVSAADLLTGNLRAFMWFPTDETSADQRPIVVLKKKLANMQQTLEDKTLGLHEKIIHRVQQKIQRGEATANVISNTLQEIQTAKGVGKKLGDLDDFGTSFTDYWKVSAEAVNVAKKLPEQARSILSIPKKLQTVFEDFNNLIGTFGKQVDGLQFDNMKSLQDSFQALTVIGSLGGREANDIVRVGLTGLHAVKCIHTISNQIRELPRITEALSGARNVASFTLSIGKVASVISAGLGVVGFVSGAVSMFGGGGGGGNRHISRALASISNQIADLHRDVSEFRRDFSVFRNEVHAQFDLVHGGISKVHQSVAFVSSQISNLTAVTIAGFNQSFDLSIQIINLTSLGFRNMVRLQDDLIHSILDPLKHNVDAALAQTRMHSFLIRSHKVTELHYQWEGMHSRLLRHLSGTRYMEVDAVEDLLDDLSTFLSTTVFHPALTGEDLIFSDDVLVTPPHLKILVDHLAKIRSSPTTLLENTGLIHTLNRVFCGRSKHPVCKRYVQLPAMPHPLLWSLAMSAYMRSVLLLPEDIGRLRTAELQKLLSFGTERLMPLAEAVQKKTRIFFEYWTWYSEACDDIDRGLALNITSMALKDGINTGTLHASAAALSLNATAAEHFVKELPLLTKRLTLSKIIMVANALLGGTLLQSKNTTSDSPRFNLTLSSFLEEHMVDTAYLLHQLNTKEDLNEIREAIKNKSKTIEKVLFNSTGYDLIDSESSPLLNIVAFQKAIYNSDLSSLFVSDSGWHADLDEEELEEPTSPNEVKPLDSVINDKQAGHDAINDKQADHDEL